MVRVAVQFAVFLLAAAPAAAEVGTCVTEGGVRMAPWTDGHDPACGADCGLEGLVDGGDDGMCALDAAGCIEGAGPVALAMPRPLGVEAPRAPAGPRCLDDEDLCGSGGPHGLAGVAGAVAALAPAPVALPRRARGLLPGTTAAWPDFGPHERDGAPEPRPPRSTHTPRSAATV